MGTKGAGTALADTERILLPLWREVLGVERVGPHDNFFELGGHSLLAIRLLGLMNEALDAELGLAVLYEHPTIAEIGTLLAGGHRRG